MPNVLRRARRAESLSVSLRAASRDAPCNWFPCQVRICHLMFFLITRRMFAAQTQCKVRRIWPNFRGRIQHLQKAEDPTLAKIMVESEVISVLRAQWFRIVVLNSVMYHSDFINTGRPPCYQLLVPRPERELIIHSCHIGMAGDHLVVRKTLNQVRRAFWISWRCDVEQYCRRCVSCNRYHRGRLPRTATHGGRRTSGVYGS